MLRNKHYGFTFQISPQILEIGDRSSPPPLDHHGVINQTVTIAPLLLPFLDPGLSAASILCVCFISRHKLAAAGRQTRSGEAKMSGLRTTCADLELAVLLWSRKLMILSQSQTEKKISFTEPRIKYLIPVSITRLK